MTIREATKDDSASIAQLAQETYRVTFGPTLTKEELTEALKLRSEDYFRNAMKTYTILIAVENNKILGFVQFGPVSYESFPTTDKDIELHKIYIDTHHQGKGIGNALMQAMVEHPRLEGIENIYLDVYDENKKALGLYKKYGFKIIGRIPFKLDGKIVGYDLLMKRSQ